MAGAKSLPYTASDTDTNNCADADARVDAGSDTDTHMMDALDDDTIDTLATELIGLGRVSANMRQANQPDLEPDNGPDPNIMTGLDDESDEDSDDESDDESGDETADEDSKESSGDGGPPAKKQKISTSTKKAKKSKLKNGSVKLTDTYEYRIGYRDDLAPLSTVEEWFADLSSNIKKLGFKRFIDHLNGRALRVATMCSGTESPILALKMISENLLSQFSINFDVEHLFSAEIVPFKQAFIERNFQPPIIFCDITELSDPLLDASQPRTATTAYGGKAEVPGDVDVLIAGFCCTDYSKLNNKPMTLAERGESGQTFYAILAYALEYKPKIIILENVVRVPWNDKIAKKRLGERGLDQHFGLIGYTSRHLILDAKEFYVPQTRQRGYLIAIHRESFKGSDEEIEGLLDQWEKDVTKLQRPASVPAEALLLKSDDPNLKFVQRENVEKGEGKKELFWNRCKMGHQLYRSALKLGVEHPITKWGPSGSKQLFDYYRTFKGFTERVLDTLDISHLRCIKRGFDDRYWNRLLDMSQNVYRTTDNTKTGIMPCLTPHGLPFSTVRGSSIAGFEALQFQALDVGSIDISTLSQSDLQDLAGNAMTSTVVGAVTAATLNIFYKLLKPGTGVKPKDERRLKLVARDLQLEKKSADPGDYSELSVEDAKAWAAVTRRLCYCEGRHDVTMIPIQQCTVCKHTTCVTCGQSPRHHYKLMDTDFIATRKCPSNFFKLIKKSIPMLFSFDNTHPSVEERIRQMEEHRPQHFTEEAWTQTLEAIRSALCSEVQFRDIIRAECWHVHFHSPLVNGTSGARVELLISEYSVEWLLYATVPPDEPLNTERRKHLEKFPFARMRPNGDDIVKGNWEFYIPEHQEAKAMITSKGKLVKSYPATIGLEGITNCPVWDKCSVKLSGNDSNKFERDISGDYESSPVCGQAYDSFHVQVSSKGSNRPVCMYFDHEKLLRSPELDHFIFTDDIRRLEYGEYRQAFARLEPTWQRPTLVGSKSITTDESSMEQEVTIHVDGHWISCQGLSIDLSRQLSVIYWQLPNQIPDPKSDCDSRHLIFACTTNLPNLISTQWVRKSLTVLTLSSEVKFFKEFRWILERGLVVADHLQHNAKWNPTTAPKIQCPTCAPKAPKLMWAYSQRNKQTPFEDPADGRDYERVLKARPRPVTIRYYINDKDMILINVEVNPKTLCHRAWAQLALSGNTEDVKVAWRVVTDDKTSNKCLLEPLTFLSSDNEIPAPPPPNVNMKKYSPRPAQLKNLAWIIRQEREPQPFLEEEVVEDRVTHINYRIEGKATREIFNGGGVLAHDVGFGKTLNILALIDCQSTWDERGAQASVPGRIPVKATVVFAPPHLVGQWEKEAKCFFPKLRNVLIIGNIFHLKARTIADYKNADIIIVNWRLVGMPSYLMLVAQFAGMVEPDTRASARALRSWYATALGKIASHVELLKSDPTGFEGHLKDEFDQDKVASQSLHAPVPSKRVTGAAYRKKVALKPPSRSKAKEAGEALPQQQEAPKFMSRSNAFKLKKVAETEDYDLMKSPIFEMFSFGRMVIDEYAYLDNRDCVKQTVMVLEFIKARHKWVLSGTPLIGGFNDIKMMAKFIGVNLGINDYSSMKSDVLNHELKDMTNSEKFLLYKTAPSPAWQEHRHNHAQCFLNQFARKDIVNNDGIKLSEQFCLVHQPAAPRATYLELMQFMSASKFEIRERPGTANLQHRKSLIHDALFQCQDAEEALLCRAAYFDLPKGDALNNAKLCEEFVEIRKGQYFEKKQQLQDRLEESLQLLKKTPDGTDDFFDDFKSCVKKNKLGDIETLNEIQEIIDNGTDIDIDIKSTSGTLRSYSSNMNKFLNQLVGLKRSWRFFQAVHTIQCLPAAHKLACQKCGHQEFTIQELTLLGQCGHLVCNSCLPREDEPCMEDQGCMMSKCSARNSFYDKIPAHDLRQESDPEAICSSGKICDIVNLLKHQIPQDERVLVFVQFPKLLQQVQEALSSNNIAFCDLGGGFESSKILSDFQDLNSSQRSRVMTLNIGDSSAAGSNLTVANHIIFVAPYHTTGSNAQYLYDAAMTQAIGRARRWGQEKTVNVYHYLVTGTIDVDIIEFRRSQILKMVAPGVGELVSGDRKDSKLGSLCYEYVSREFY